MTESDRDSNQLSVAEQISNEMETLYATHYGHSRGTATTYINGKTILCMVEGSRSESESDEFARGEQSDVIDRRVAFQVNQEDAFTEMVERITKRRVVAFLSANQDSLTFAAELFVLDEEPRAE